MGAAEGTGGRAEGEGERRAVACEGEEAAPSRGTTGGEEKRSGKRSRGLASHPREKGLGGGLCSRGVLSSLLLGAGGPCRRRTPAAANACHGDQRRASVASGQQAPDPRLQRETLEPWREKQHELTEHELGTSGLLHPKSPTARRDEPNWKPRRDEPNWKPDAEKRIVRAHIPRHQRGPSSRRIRPRPRAPPRASAAATPRPRASAPTPPPPTSPARPSAAAGAASAASGATAPRQGRAVPGAHLRWLRHGDSRGLVEREES
ncbi:hypothetical protein PVAP13_6NG086403 [Panicum virgatum]|uniref:Uncharacterized protein n=1 Tax=Panicum virgatum TaxID=38727 RepID=A0A8T0QZ11_PANVG|nr:hypothetical protein PVAP13_6NG086403 [Panicum virgatum]